ncbi:MAG: MFS transporter [Clostridia bacterium]|nr:MFS transporter [Clostridia bacterium]
MHQKRNQVRSPKSGAWLLIFLGWLVYTTSYLGKVNYSANITQIIDFYGVTKAQAGIVPTFFFFAYGIGQVVNGLLCKKYHMKWMVFASLLVSAAINLTIAVSTDFTIIKWLWLVNGFSLSILWPTLVRLLSESLPKKNLGTSSVVMGTTTALGTLIIYGLSSLFVAFGRFKLSFYTAGFAILAVAMVWFFCYNKAVAVAKEEKNAEEMIKETKTASFKQELQKGGERKLFLVSIYVMCFCAIGVNLIKDGLTTWVPSILKEAFSMSDSLSILLTLLLPILAVFGNAYALKLHKKIPDYVNHCAAVFAVIAVLIGVIIGSLTLELAVCMLIGLVAVNFLASSLNSLITSIVPLFMREKMNSGFLAGILNGFCYLGSTISSYGLGVIADGYGWTAVFYTLIGFCLLAIMVWAGYAIYKRAMTSKI